MIKQKFRSVNANNPETLTRNLFFTGLLVFLSLGMLWAQNQKLRVEEGYLGKGFDRANEAGKEISYTEEAVVVVIASNGKTRWTEDIMDVSYGLISSTGHTRLIIIKADIQNSETINNAFIYVKGTRDFVIGEQAGTDGLDLESQIQLLGLLHETVHKVEPDE